ncbi:MAG: GGDEF domain-containing protein [Deltaproteobacteria bacterium]|nr:GGDEF domain-containing protein [Deltaproteobacteria bacterium]
MKQEKGIHFNGWLKKPETPWDDILGILGDAIAIFIQPHWELIYCNQRFQYFLEYTQDELRGKTFGDFVAEDNLPKMQERFYQRLLQVSPPSNYEIRVKSKSGRIYTMDVMAQLYPGNHKPLGVLLSMRDRAEKREQLSLWKDTELKHWASEESEAKHRASRELGFQTLVERSLEGMMIIQENRVRYANPMMLEFIGVSESEMMGRNVMDMVHPDDRAAMKDHIQECLQDLSSQKPHELRVLKKSGGIIYLEALCILTDYHSQPALLVTCRDITNRKRQEERIQELIITDNLTGLFNRRHLYNELNAEIQRARRQGSPLSLIMIDIDSFKHYNDTCGHIEGDRVLVRLAEVIRRFKRRYDSAFRYGGEEFVVICPGIDGKQAMNVSERLRNEFQKERFASGKNGFIEVTISLGVANLKAGDSTESFIKHADEAMYISKRNGKNRSTLAPNNGGDR